jgi:hypothetical protein
MTRFSCIASGREAEFAHDPERQECPVCGSADVVFALGIEECPTSLSRRWVGPNETYGD